MQSFNCRTPFSFIQREDLLGSQKGFLLHSAYIIGVLGRFKMYMA